MLETSTSPGAAWFITRAPICPAIPVTFRQTEAAAAEYIVIDDEIITNSTGYDWSDFHIDLLNGPDAVFDPVKTWDSGGGLPIGFYITPFTEAAFDDPSSFSPPDPSTESGPGVWRPFSRFPCWTSRSFRV